MGGGLMQLVAYGAQDIYLTSNPQITFFKVVYRRHTNFSREVIEQTFSGSPGPNKNINVTISRNGDLVHKVYLETPAHKVSASDSFKCSNPGHSMIEHIELEIGGQRIDRHYQEWNEIWSELSTPESKAIGLKTGVVENVLIEKDLVKFKNIHTVSLYINKLRQKEYYDYIISLKPKRVIFNPGTENPDFYRILKSNHISYFEACTLVLLSTNQY